MRNVLALALLLSTVAIASAAGGKDGAVISNSGSTNTAGYTIKLWSDGAGQVALSGGAPRSIHVDVDLAAKFFTDVKAARENPGIPGHCMKSASFGTTTGVLWHAWKSPDLQCPPFNTAMTALAADVHNIQTAANLSNPPHRLRLPMEPRMIPKASPEVTPT